MFLLSARLLQQAKDNLETLKAHQARLIQQSKDNLNIQRARLSRLNEEMKHDESMLKEELKLSLWQLERNDIAECNALQESLRQHAKRRWRRARLIRQKPKRS